MTTFQLYTRQWDGYYHDYMWNVLSVHLLFVDGANVDVLLDIIAFA